MCWCAYFKNFFFRCRTTDALAFLPTRFKLSSAVVNVTVDARLVEKVIARSRCKHLLAAGTQLLETYHTLTLQHVARCKTFMSMLQQNQYDTLGSNKLSDTIFRNCNE